MSRGSALQRFRVPLGFVFAALFLAAAQPRPLTFLVGVAIAFVGLAIRAWAAGHIVKTTRLTTSGPYAHTRNPLYFGSFLLAAGFGIAAHWTVLLLVIAFWVMVYWPVIERERAGISGAFPDAYPEYERNVPAFVPRLRPWRGGGAASAAGAGGADAEEPSRFDARLYMRHREWQAALGFALVVAWLAYRTRWNM